MTEKFIADFNVPRVGSEFYYVADKPMPAEAFTRKAAAAFLKTEKRNKVVLGAITLELNPLTGLFIASAPVITVLN